MSASSRHEISFLRNKPNRYAAAAKTINGSARIEKARLKWSSAAQPVSKPSTSRSSLCARLSPVALARCNRSQNGNWSKSRSASFRPRGYWCDALMARRISRRRSSSNRQPRGGPQPDRESFTAAVGSTVRNSRGSTASRPWRNSKCSCGSLTFPVEPTRAMTCPRDTFSPRFTSS